VKLSQVRKRQWLAMFSVDFCSLLPEIYGFMMSQHVGAAGQCSHYVVKNKKSTF
jgi:hypothetical protein